MSSGTRVVLGFLVLAVTVFLVLWLYGDRALHRRAPDSPQLAAREAVQADNTVVGLVGAIETFDPVDVALAEDDARAALEARVVGTRDSGRMRARLSIEDGRWTVDRATFTLSDGTTIPIAGGVGR